MCSDDEKDDMLYGADFKAMMKELHSVSEEERVRDRGGAKRRHKHLVDMVRRGLGSLALHTLELLCSAKRRHKRLADMVMQNAGIVRIAAHEHLVRVAFVAWFRGLYGFCSSSGSR